MVWWQIQRAKQLKSTEVILFLVSPSQYTDIHGVYIENGKLADMFSLDCSDFGSLISDINRRELHTSIHVDLCKGDPSFSGSGIDNRVIYLYTSLYKEDHLWSDKVQFNSAIAYLPSWSEEELHDFYLIMDANCALVNKLRFVRLNDTNDEKIPESYLEDDILQVKSSSQLYPLTLFETSDKVQQVRMKHGEHTYAVSYVDFKTVVTEEMLLFGPTPLYLFLANVNRLFLYTNMYTREKKRRKKNFKF